MKSELSRFPLFNDRHTVNVSPSSDGVCMNYRTTSDDIPVGSTHFDLEIIGDACYILWIELHERHRGLGHGRKLYGIIEDIARKSGCKRVIQTPSGSTPNGKSRRDYVLGLGYKRLDSTEMCKEL